MKCKNLIALLITVFMVISMFPVTAFANDPVVAKIGNTEYGTLADAVAAAQAGQTVEIIKAGTYPIPNPIDGVTIDGTQAGGKEKVVFDVSKGSGQLASTSGVVTFKAVSFQFGNNGYTGFQHPGEINFINCNIEGYFQSYGTMNFTDCVFTQINLNYSMWCYAGDCTYTSCVFNEAEAALNLYNEGNNKKDANDNIIPWVITVENCTFNHTSSEKESYSAILLKTYNKTAYKLILKGNNTVGSGTWTGTKDNGIVVVKSNNNCLVWAQSVRENEPSSVWQEDTQVWPAPDGVAKIGDTVYKTLEAALTASMETPNTTITLLSDIEVVPTHTINNNYGAVTLGSGYNCDGLVLDGNGHTIKLKDNNFSTVKYDVIHVSGGNITFKNLIVDANGTGTQEITKNSKCAFSINSNATVAFDNVTVKNTNGGWSAFNVNKSTIELTDCTAKENVLQVISCDGGNETSPSAATIKSGEYDGTIRTEGNNANNKLYIKGGTYTFNTKNSDLTIDKASNSILEITGGIFSVDPSAYVVEGYDSTIMGTTPETWTVQKKTSFVIIDVEEKSKKIEIKQDTEIDNEKASEVYGENAEAAIQATKVEGVELTTEGEKTGLQQLIDKALEVADQDKKNALIEAEILTVDIKVAVEPQSSNENRVVVKLTPIATIKSGDTVVAEDIKVDNTMIDQTKEISVTIYIGFEAKQLIHRDDNGKIIEVFNEGDFIYNETDKTVTVKINHFSTIEGSKDAYVAEIGTTKYETLQAAIDAAAAGQTIILLKNLDMANEDLTIGDNVFLDLNHFSLTNIGTLTNKGVIVLHQENADIVYDLLYNVPGNYAADEELKLPTDVSPDYVIPASTFMTSEFGTNPAYHELNFASGEDTLVWNKDVPAGMQLDVTYALALGGNILCANRDGIKPTKVIANHFSLNDDIAIGGNDEGDGEATLFVESIPADLFDETVGTFVSNGKKITLNKSGKLVISSNVVFDESVLVSGAEGMIVSKTENTTEGTITYFIKTPHTHNPIKVDGKAATTKEAGFRSYYKCDCGKYFEDATCNVEINDLDKWKSKGGAGYIEKLEENPKSPQTGDTSNMNIWIMLMAFFFIGLCACLILDIKKGNQKS